MGGAPGPVVIVAGLRGDVADHWQSHLARRLPPVHVVDSFGRGRLDLDGRVDDLRLVLDSLDGPATIVAHSAGVLVTAHWATRDGGTGRVGGALLATPPDLVTPLPSAYPSIEELAAAGWLPVPTGRLPFPSILAVGSDDPLSDPERIRALGEAWGSDLREIGPVGHLNPASGYGTWPLAEELVRELAGQSSEVAGLTSPWS